MLYPRAENKPATRLKAPDSFSRRMEIICRIALYQNHFVETGTGRNHGIDVFVLIGDEVEEHQAILHGHRLSQRAFDVARLLNQHADVTIGLGQLHEVRQGVHIRHRVTALVEELLPLPHLAEVTIIEIDDLDRQLILQTGRELLYAHLDAALARDTGDGGVGGRELHAHRGGQAEAHGAEAARVDPAARLVKLVVLRGPHLVLTDVRCHEGVAVGDLVQLLEHVLRLDDLARAVVLEAVHAAPFADLPPPRRERLLVWLALGGLHEADHVVQHHVDRADDGHVDLHVLRDRRGVDVDLHDLRGRTEFLHVARDAVGDARADGDQHVAVVHGLVGFIGAVHAQHAEELFVGRGIAAEAHQGIGDGITEQAREFGERLGRVAQHHAAAGVDHGAFRGEDEVHGLLDLAWMTLRHRVVRTDRNGLGVVIFGLVRGDVFRNVHQHRPGAAAGRDIKRLFDGLGEVLHVFDEEVVLDARTGDADGGDLLERSVADQLRRYLTGDDDHGDGVHVGRGDAGDGIGGAGARGHQHHAGLAGRAGITVGRVGGALLVADQDVLDVFLLEQGIVNVEHRPTWVAKHVFDALVLQTADDDIGTGHFHEKLPQTKKTRVIVCQTDLLELKISTYITRLGQVKARNGLFIMWQQSRLVPAVPPPAQARDARSSDYTGRPSRGYYRPPARGAATIGGWRDSPRPPRRRTRPRSQSPATTTPPRRIPQKKTKRVLLEAVAKNHPQQNPHQQRHHTQKPKIDAEFDRDAETLARQT